MRRSKIKHFKAKLAGLCLERHLPPTSAAAEVIESVPSVCLCICLSALSRLNRWTHKNYFWYGDVPQQYLGQERLWRSWVKGQGHQIKQSDFWPSKTHFVGFLLHHTKLWPIVHLMTSNDVTAWHHDDTAWLKVTVVGKRRLKCRASTVHWQCVNDGAFFGNKLTSGDNTTILWQGLSAKRTENYGTPEVAPKPPVFFFFGGGGV